MSKWHAIGVQAWVKQLEARHGRIAGLVFMRTHRVSGAALSRDDFPFFLDRPDVVVTDDSGFVTGNRRMVAALRIGLKQALRKGASKSGQPVYFASPQRVDWAVVGSLASESFFDGRDVEFTLLDEGVGSYITPAMWRSFRRSDNKATNSSWFAREIQSLYSEMRVMAQGSLEHFLGINNYFVFDVDPESGALRPNTEIVSRYREVLKLHGNELDFFKVMEMPIQLVITQPWVEQEELEWFVVEQQLMSLIARGKQKGYLTLLKPHPREDFEKYRNIENSFSENEFRFLRVDLAVEALLSELDPSNDIVVGYSSTALISASVFFDVKAYSMGYEVISRKSGVGTLFKEHFNAFAIMTPSLVSDVRTMQILN